MDSEALTLTPPPCCLDWLCKVLQWLQPPRKRLATSKWHRLLGDFRSLSPALPGTQGLFSVLQHALSGGDKLRVLSNQLVNNTEANFAELANYLAVRPTHLRELVPTAPSLLISASDAKLAWAA